MALPTSTIVMAVLTCIPFGLAIRDTVNGTTPASRDDDEELDDDDAEAAAYNAEWEAAEARREAAEAETTRLEELKRTELQTARRTLFGAEVATLGAGFEGTKLGMPESAMVSDPIIQLEDDTGTDIELLANTTLDWILIKPDGELDEDEMCTLLRKDLREAWGPGKTDDYERYNYWVNPTTGTRASISGDDECRISLERYAEPKAWINKTKTSIVPMWLVGQPIAKLREHLGTRSEFEDGDSDVRWLGLGVGHGSGEARFEAHLVKGKVVAITAVADALETTYDEVLAQLTALHGAPREHEEDGVYWKRPAIQLTDYQGAGVFVSIGKLPDNE